jgi:CHAD domain-containing protein
LAASLIGAVGLGVGLALTRAEFNRRSARTRRTPERRPAPHSGQPLSAVLHAMALEHLDLAIDSLSGASGTDSAAAIHETRKAIRRQRTLLRLLSSELGIKRVRREDRALRRCARRLAGARDGEVVLVGLDAIVDRHPRLAGKSAIVRLRMRLLAERELARRDTGLTSATREEVLEQLRTTREWVRGWRLQEGGFELLSEDARAIYRDGRQSMRVARKRAGTSAMHDWRKRVKDLRYATEMLTPEDPRTTSDLKYMRRLARRSDRLAELLGEEHDLALLTERVRERREVFAAHKRTRKTLLRKIEQRREDLREEALELGERLYETSAKEFVRAIGKTQ